MAGYLFGHALELLLADIKKVEVFVLLIILFAGLLVWVWRYWRFRNRSK